MEELLVPGSTRGYVIPRSSPDRKTRFDLTSVRHGRPLVSIDSQMANRLVGRLLAARAIPDLDWGDWRPERRHGHHRFDFAVGPEGARPVALLEVKSSNLKVDRVARFPDAPTLRGTAHVRALRRAVDRGIRAAVLFVVQRDDVESFRPNAALDPSFAQALQSARQHGVQLFAQTVRVRPDGADWGRPLTVETPLPEVDFL